MPDRIDDIYKTLIEYIQKDNEDKSKIKEALEKGQSSLKSDLIEIKGKVQSIEEQTKKTNGRVTTLELTTTSLQENNQKRVIVSRVNWKWVSGIGAIVTFVWSFVSVFVYKWIENHFYK